MLVSLVLAKKGVLLAIFGAVKRCFIYYFLCFFFSWQHGKGRIFASFVAFDWNPAKTPIRIAPIPLFVQEVSKTSFSIKFDPFYVLLAYYSAGLILNSSFVFLYFLCIQIKNHNKFMFSLMSFDQEPVLKFVGNYVIS